MICAVSGTMPLTFNDNFACVTTQYVSNGPPTRVPEPATLGLLGLGLLALGLFAKPRDGSDVAA